jgi:hypothetical protein
MTMDPKFLLPLPKINYAPFLNHQWMVLELKGFPLLSLPFLFLRKVQGTAQRFLKFFVVFVCVTLRLH